MFLTHCKNKCPNDKSVESLIHRYILKNAVRSRGYSVDLACAAEQMKALRNFFRVSSVKRVLYFRVTFLEYESVRLTADRAEKIAQGVCEEYSDEYQIVYGVHYFGLRWYLHIVLNPVNMYTGEILEMDACERGMLEAYLVSHSGFDKISTYIE